MCKDDRAVRMHLLSNNRVAFQDLKSGLFATKSNKGFGWESGPPGGDHRQIFKLVESENSVYPYGILSMDGEFLSGSSDGIFKKTSWLWTKTLGDQESFKVQDMWTVAKVLTEPPSIFSPASWFARKRDDNF